MAFFEPVPHSIPNITNSLDIYPASIATLAQRQPLRWANVGSPTLGQRGFVNWPNGGTPTLAQRCANIGPTVAH